MKSSIAALLVQLFVTLALVHATHVVVLPTVIVAASPVSHLSPWSHWSPFAPLGIVKFNTAAADVQELVTLALVQGSQVVVDHTVMVAASHWSP